ncbi:2-deoxyglucose-6-phosphatase [Rouxiella silvae]|uniref:2-deoxyglucose-6-phosphatase n=1 Tax=Rouxiella silvae TaxID=1646373 RepID=A0AA40X2T7_9GAMM|nr:hexitol phosphatase HxpB [Rouxiella silvae]MBF6637510.1 hexitol phosphatase HxpB [Rouxiella silvae]ORJ19709.1 2-deoxyglucose-6-phosphatase [Rouxiella silvae]
MSHVKPVQAAIFDMDGLLIDSEPLWMQSELEIFSSIGVDITKKHLIPHTLGLRIDQTVRIWAQALPWKGPSEAEVTARIIARTLELVEEKKPLLPGVVQALALCQARGLKIGLASASPLHMLDKVLEMFNLQAYFQTRTSAENLAYSKPHPEVYLLAAESLGVDPLDCVTLEDSFNGMIATKAARMRSIVVPDHTLSDDPRWTLADVKLASLTDLTAEHLG